MNIRPNFFYAWIILTVALTLHVLDEALNDFLSIYNPLVALINQRMGFSFFPIFSTTKWLTGLMIGIIILFGFSFFAYREKKWILSLSYFYGVLMLLNGLGHFLGSLYYSKLIAGIYTSPLLLGGSIYLIWSTTRTIKSRK